MIVQHDDIAMTYEELARAVFDCERFEGPYRCADASVYDRNFAPTANAHAGLIMKAIVDRIMDDGNYSESENDYLLDIRNTINNATDQGIIIDAINNLVGFLNANGY